MTTKPTPRRARDDLVWQRGWEKLRLGVVLAHSLPDLVLELGCAGINQADSRGRVHIVRVSAMSCCTFRHDLAHTLASGTVPEMLADYGIDPSRLSVRLDESRVAAYSIGGGVYRYAADDAWGYVSATVLAPRSVDGVLDSLGQAWNEPVQLHRYVDRDLGATLVYTEHPTSESGARLLAKMAAVATDVASALAVEELVESLRH